MIRVFDYDPAWTELFNQIRERVWPHVSDVAIAFEHVGSTSVPGLASKPVIDIDVVIPSRTEFPQIVQRLTHAGYAHQGDLGIDDREAFRESANDVRHNLYVCSSESLALRNHVTLRDHLRAHPDDLDTYAALKKRLAVEFPDDIDGYAAAKTDFILSILTRHDFSADALDRIREANRRP
jgi:GrpB-like predicted nucleotidyltransferase (UPF0157 family)